MVYVECQQDFYHVMKFTRTPILRKGGFTLIELMVVIAILAALGSISYPAIIDRMNDGDRQIASSNLKQVYTMMQQFNTDRSTYPCDSSAEELTEAHPDINFGELSGNDSNAYFRQLLMVERTPSEKVFYAKVNCAGKVINKEGDDKVANGRALERGENAISYVMRKSSEDSSKVAVNKTNAPLAIAGVYPAKAPYAGDRVAYDNSSFRGHVFVLSCDGSVKDIKEDIQEDDMEEDKATLKDGKNIFPETKKGRNTAPDYIVLTPDL